MYIFFFKQKTAYEMRISDWSSDVCSSDLGRPERDLGGKRAGKIFLGHGLQTGPDMLLERVARIDLMPGNTNIHMPSPYSCRTARDWRPGRRGGVKAVHP